MTEPISCRAYAKLRGVSAMSVSIAIRDGRLVKSVGRTPAGMPCIADVELANQEWEANTQHEYRVKAAGGLDAPGASLPPPRRTVTLDTGDYAEVLPPAPQEAQKGTGSSVPGAGEDDESEDGESLQDASRRQKHWQAKLAELKFKQAAGELIPSSNVERDVNNLLTSVRVKLLGVPSRAIQSLPHLTSADLTVLQALVREALEEIAREDDDERP